MAKLMPKVLKSLDLDIFEKKNLVVLFYEYVSFNFLNKQKYMFHTELIPVQSRTSFKNYHV